MRGRGARGAFWRFVACGGALALVTGACASGGGSGTNDGAGGASDNAGTAPQGAAAAFDVQSSVEQLIVTGAEPREALTVYDAGGEVAGEGVADEAGQLVVRILEPGDGYVVAAGDGDALETSEATTVWAIDDVPDESLYESQTIEPGYQYVETRDGTLLAVNVTLPGPPEDGPYPTLVEYSGYTPANPDEPQPSTLIANVMGFATVGVNMRGTGCSGGSFLFFEPAQSTDGYDVVETIARQPWVEHGKVGMIGISYPGISQLYVAHTRPPHLASIAPLSVIADTYRSTLRPGGILNDGFAIDWAEERQREAAPAGQAWAAKRIDEGDQVCEQNQAMRSQNPDTFELIDDHPYYDDLLARVTPADLVGDIDVPVFLAGAWQDEQTGGHFPNMLDRFDSAPVTRFTLVNGGHADALMPAIFQRWSEFLDFYVKREIPHVPDSAPAVLAGVGSTVFGTPLTLPPDRFDSYTSYDEALAAYEAERSVRVLFENGAGDEKEPGAPVPRFEATFDEWPIPETDASTWYLQPGGGLALEAGDAESAESFRYDLSLAHTTTLADGVSPWQARPPWDWKQVPAGAALAYETEPLAGTLVMAGPGSVDLSLGATAPDVDLQVVLSEVRPDGKEVYVQAGWLRASQRALDEDLTTELRPWHTHLEDDVELLPEGERVDLRLALFPFAHVFRAGSKIRIVVSAPGGVRPLWTFDALEAPDGTTASVGVGGGASRLVLPVLPDLAADAPPALPACPSLRGQPCRDYAPIENTAEPGGGT